MSSKWFNNIIGKFKNYGNQIDRVELNVISEEKSLPRFLSEILLLSRKYQREQKSLAGQIKAS